MMKACTAFLMIIMLLFGNVCVPAMADAGTSGHTIEMLDLECHDAESDGDDGKDSPVAPAGHIDHHHCSVAVPNHPPSVATAAKYANSKFLDRPVCGLTSHQTAPPTEPPAA